jgi:hypothetical protein
MALNLAPFGRWTLRGKAAQRRLALRYASRMTRHTNNVVPQYDFSAALALTVDERIARSLNSARRLVAENGYQKFSDYPCVPETGASEEELAELEGDLGRPLPDEYRKFLSQCRYLKIDDGCEIGGLDHNGVYVAAIPWISGNHRPGVKYMVFADYWRFADGDQLMFDLSDPIQPVVAYLHEHGPLYESYAPSFSLALWRLVNEVDKEA